MKAFKNLINLLIVLTITSIIASMFCTNKRQQDEQQVATVDPNKVETPKQIEPTLDPITAEGEISLARNFYFIFDGSGSMRDKLGSDCGGDQSFKRKLEGAKWAVAEFLKKVPEDVNLGLYIFDEHHVPPQPNCEVVPLASNNMTAFLQAINNVEAGGGTPLSRAIQYGAEVLAKQKAKQLGYGEFRLVVVTDGLADDIPQAAEFATEKEIPIYAIGLCIQEDHPLRQYAVSYRAANSFEDLTKALEATVAETEFYDAKSFEALSEHSVK